MRERIGASLLWTVGVVGRNIEAAVTLVVEMAFDAIASLFEQK